MFSNKTTVELDFGQTFSKGDSNTPAYHWIMSKDVSDPAQVMEGLQTRGDTK